MGRWLLLLPGITEEWHDKIKKIIEFFEKSEISDFSDILYFRDCSGLCVSHRCPEILRRPCGID